MEAMGGKVAAEDTPGGGLTIVLTLPRAPARNPVASSFDAAVPRPRDDALPPAADRMVR
jgi:two-component system sensor histidine kinase KdpD